MTYEQRHEKISYFLYELARLDVIDHLARGWNLYPEAAQTANTLRRVCLSIAAIEEVEGATSVSEGQRQLALHQLRALENATTYHINGHREAVIWVLVKDLFPILESGGLDADPNRRQWRRGLERSLEYATVAMAIPLMIWHLEDLGLEDEEQQLCEELFEGPVAEQVIRRMDWYNDVYQACGDRLFFLLHEGTLPIDDPWAIHGPGGSAHGKVKVKSKRRKK